MSRRGLQIGLSNKDAEEHANLHRLDSLVTHAQSALGISHIASAAIDIGRDGLRRRRRPEAAGADPQTHHVAAVGRREEGEHCGHARRRRRRNRRGTIAAETGEKMREKSSQK